MRYGLLILFSILALLDTSAQKRPDTTARNRPRSTGLYDIIPYPSGRAVIVGKNGWPIALNVDSSNVFGLGAQRVITDARISARTAFQSVSSLRASSLSGVMAPGAINVTDSRKQGLFVLDAADSSTPDNLGTVLVTASGLRYKRAGIVHLYPTWWGAVGDSITNDQSAFQALFNYAKLIRNASIELDPNAKYRLASGVTYDVASEGQIRNNNRSIIIHGNNAKVFVSGTTGSYYAFSFLFGAVPENDAKVRVENLYIYTDNVNRPNGIYTNRAAFIQIDNVTFYQIWQALKMDNAGMASVRDCHAFGCATGFDTYKARDFQFNNCMAYACAKGYFFEGINDGGGAGALSVIDCKAVACDSNWHLRRLQTARFTDIISDVPGSIGMAVESCNYLQLTNFIGGPNTGSGVRTQIRFSVYPGATNNDYCQLANIQADNQIIFDHCNFMQVTNLTIRGAPQSGDSSAVVIANSGELSATNWKVRDLISLANAVKIKSSAGRISINGGEFDQPIYFEGIASARAGGHNINNPDAKGGIKFGPTGYFPRADETGIFHSGSGNTRKTVEDGFVYPYVILPQFSMASGDTVSYSLNALLPTPPAAGAYRATLVTNGGTFGSFGTSVIEVIRNYTTTQATILSSSIPSTSCTVSLPSAGVIRFTASAGSVAKLTLVKIEKIPE